MEPILISLDGNIGAGKSTLLARIKAEIPNVTVVQEPVASWLTMKNDAGESLLGLFYKDTPRWSYTFQNCALLTRLLDTQDILSKIKSGEIRTPIVITERSVLTDCNVFATMLRKQGKMDTLEWELYMRWYTNFAKDLPYKGIIHLTTSASTSKERIVSRNRSGEESIPMTYLDELDKAHHDWVDSSHLPVLQINNENGKTEDILDTITSWLQTNFKGALTSSATIET